MPVATIDGLQVNYVVKGEGIPLLMLAPPQQNADTVKRWILDSVAAGKMRAAA